MKEVSTVALQRTACKQVKRFAKRVARALKQRAACKQVKRFAERVAPVAQTTHPTQAGLARVLNSLVVPPFLRRGNFGLLARLLKRSNRR
jgi:hypothetical protein